MATVSDRARDSPTQWVYAGVTAGADKATIRVHRIRIDGWRDRSWGGSYDTILILYARVPWFRTKAVAPVGSSTMSRGSAARFGFLIAPWAGLALELISDRFPLPKSMAKELTLFPTPLLPWVSTYKSPEGREEELPQLSRNKLRAHRPTSATTHAYFLRHLFSQEIRFASISRPGDALPAVTET